MNMSARWISPFLPSLPFSSPYHLPPSCSPSLLPRDCFLGCCCSHTSCQCWLGVALSSCTAHTYLILWCIWHCSMCCLTWTQNWFLRSFSIFGAMSGIKPMALCLQGKHSTTEILKPWAHKHKYLLLCFHLRAIGLNAGITAGVAGGLNWSLSVIKWVSTMSRINALLDHLSGPQTWTFRPYGLTDL